MNTGIPVVNDPRPCFCFDGIRDQDYCVCGLKTTDSLYFAFNSSRLIFAEFKSRKARNKVQREIAIKAADTLYMHWDICLRNNFQPSLVPLCYLAVYDYGKNPHLLGRTAVILARSGNGSSLAVLTNGLRSLYLQELCRKHPEIIDLYSGFEVVLSNSFSGKITALD